MFELLVIPRRRQPKRPPFEDRNSSGKRFDEEYLPALSGQTLITNMMLSDLKRSNAEFFLEAYFKAAEHPERKEINVGQPAFLGPTTVIDLDPPRRWKTLPRCIW